MTTNLPFISPILINPSLALALRNAVNDLNPECLTFAGVPRAGVDLEDRDSRMCLMES